MQQAANLYLIMGIAFDHWMLHFSSQLITKLYPFRSQMFDLYILCCGLGFSSIHLTLDSGNSISETHDDSILQILADKTSLPICFSSTFAFSKAKMHIHLSDICVKLC